MSTFQQKITKHTKKQKNTDLREWTSTRIKQEWQEVVKYQTWNVFKCMINMLRDLMEKEDNMQVHIENMSREMEILRKTKKSIITDQKH